MDELNSEKSPLASAEVSIDDAGTAVVAIVGELDMSSVPAIEEQVRPALENAPGGVVVDLDGLTFADSSGIAMWVRWSLTCSSFELRNPPALVQRVIVAMGLSSRLGIPE